MNNVSGAASIVLKENVVFNSIRWRRNNRISFKIDNVKYSIQRITPSQVKLLPVKFNNYKLGLYSQNYKGNYIKNDRIEKVYFYISRLENYKEEVIGIAEFSYLSILKAYNNKQLFSLLDDERAEWGIIGAFLEERGCGKQYEISPYILLFDKIYGNIRDNKKSIHFLNNIDCKKKLYAAATILVSDYMKINKNDITLMNISNKYDEAINNFTDFMGFKVNYIRDFKL